MATKLQEHHAATTGDTQLTEEQRALLPSDEDVQFYHEHGYYISKQIFTDDEVDAMLRGSDRFYALDLDEPHVGIFEKFRPTGDYGDGLRKHDYASFFNRELARLTRSPLIGAIAARLADSPSIRLWHDQLLYKPADSPNKKIAVGWHTDRQYWKACSSAAMLTAWIPFHDCDETMGTISFIDRSHRWPDNTDGLDFFSRDLEGLEQRFNTGGEPVTRVPANLRKGQVSFHNCLTIHGSGPNRGGAPRRSIAVHLQNEANCYQAYRRPDGQLATHSNVILCRKVDGVPDFADPVVCPVLFHAR
jgi:ectoine hydroxylase-related dioxygenase (phytanoyl-CoA dioxygenase family)